MQISKICISIALSIFENILYLITSQRDSKIVEKFMMVQYYLNKFIGNSVMTWCVCPFNVYCILCARGGSALVVTSISCQY